MLYASCLTSPTRSFSHCSLLFPQSFNSLQLAYNHLLAFMSLSPKSKSLRMCTLLTSMALAAVKNWKLYALFAVLNAIPCTLSPFHGAVAGRSPKEQAPVILSFGVNNNLEKLWNGYQKSSIISNVLTHGCSSSFHGELLKKHWTLHFSIHLLHLVQICMIYMIVQHGKICTLSCSRVNITWYLACTLIGSKHMEIR